MKKMSGRLKEEKGENDNLRAKRYLTKLTIKSAITHVISDYVGSLEPGKMADIVVCCLDSTIFRCKTQINNQRRLLIIFIDGGSQRFYSYPRTWSLQIDVWVVRSYEVFTFSNVYFKTCNKKWFCQKLG